MLYSGPCRPSSWAPFVSTYFQDDGTGTSLGRRSFTVLSSGKYFDYVYSQWQVVELLYCFVLNCRKPGNIYLLDEVLDFFVWFAFVFALLDSVLNRGKPTNYSSKWTLKVGNFLWRRSSAVTSEDVCWGNTKRSADFDRSVYYQFFTIVLLGELVIVIQKLPLIKHDN